MLFLFIGGVNQQVRRMIEYGAGRCGCCGSFADLVECDNVLRLFFIPLWSWSAGGPVMHCSNCHLFFHPSSNIPRRRRRRRTTTATPFWPTRFFSLDDDWRCTYCEGIIQPQFSFCPSCGFDL